MKLSFSRSMLPMICNLILFFANNNSKNLSFFTSSIFFPVDISKFSVMSSTTSQSSSAFHSFFNKEQTSAETKTWLDFISSIWDDDHIQRLDEKNWQCLWCNQNFQVINVTKALAHVLGKKDMHIISWYVAKGKAHTTRYQ